MATVGAGSMSEDFVMSLEWMHNLTSRCKHELLVEMTSETENGFARYSYF